jgi:outer membrane receptor protein involved in Fe transport
VAQYQEAPDGAQTVVLGSVRIEAARDLPERTSAGAGEVPSDGQIAITLRGWTVQVGGGRVVVAGRDFGPAPAEGLVRLSLAGVHVAGELRGPLPE